MNSFLKLTAQHMLEKHGCDFSHLTVVFPNKRAGLFFKQELARLTDKPIWAPRFQSIQDLFIQFSGKVVADSTEAICTLYRVYQQHLSEKERGKESIDQFYSWGEIILSDFDDIDKHLVDARKLFINARDLNELTEPHFMTEDQKNTLEKFFSDFSEDRMTELKSRFKALWGIMPEVYNDLGKAMPEGVEPYTGALMRHVIESEDITSRIDPREHYAFVGFNMLGEAEVKLMTILTKRGQASFYWDYDIMYLKDTRFEAGDFIRKNLERFPNELKNHQDFNNLAGHGKMTFISSPTDSIQSRYIPAWLQQYINNKEEKGRTENRTAIVLCDETMLESVLHGIPSQGEPGAPDAVNVTMGFPLTSTPIYSLIVNLLALQTDGIDRKRNKLRRRQQRAVAAHPYIHYVAEEVWSRITAEDDLTALLSYVDDIITQDSLIQALHTQPLAALHEESLFQAHKTLTKFINMLAEDKLDRKMKPITLRRLLKRVLGVQTIPFHGEPATGIQVMGVLETRCLDFDNILMLNVGEGLLPKGLVDNSMIPYNLRVAFGMTTVMHRMATFAYYFYRLIQRARNVTCIYNDSTAKDAKKNEMSRFLRQIQAETDIPIENLRLDAEQQTVFRQSEDVPKTERVMEILEGRYLGTEKNSGHVLSPSAINTYLSCPMEFYFKYVAGLREKQEDEDGIDKAMLGDIFHQAAQSAYEWITSKFNCKTITRDQLGMLLADKARLLQPHINRAFEQLGGVTEYDGENIILREVVEKYLRNLIRYDMTVAPFTIKRLEGRCCMELEIETRRGKTMIKTGGIIDRMDYLEEKGITRIVDYKTGRFKDLNVKMEELTDLHDKTSEKKYTIQTLLYSTAVLPESPGAVKPVLFYPAQAGKKDYDPSIRIDGEVIEDVRTGTLLEDFRQQITEKLNELFNPEIPFTRCTDSCQYCPFSTFCQY